MKTKIISHRGAAGLALENTAASLQLAVQLDVAAIELDVRLTKDKQLVVWHDADLYRLLGDKRFLADMTLAEVRRVKLPDGSRILTLHEALDLTDNVPCIVDIRDNSCAELVLAEVKHFKRKSISVASRRLDELKHLRKLDAKLPLYSLDHTRALENVHLARMFGFNGIGMNYWLLNPLTYWYARRRKLSVYVYTVDKRWLVRFFGWLYPEVAVCTDHPEWFVTERIQKGAKHARRPAQHPA